MTPEDDVPTSGREARVYETKDGKSPFERWFNRLERYVAAKITRTITKLEAGGKPDTSMVRPGVFEARIHWGPGYRIYFALDGDEVVILLGGGEKRTQADDIDHAQECWNDYKERKKQLTKKG